MPSRAAVEVAETLMQQGGAEREEAFQAKDHSLVEVAAENSSLEAELQQILAEIQAVLETASH
jgi:hypothetical protein